MCPHRGHSAGSWLRENPPDPARSSEIAVSRPMRIAAPLHQKVHNLADGSLHLRICSAESTPRYICHTIPLCGACLFVESCCGGIPCLIGIEYIKRESRTALLDDCAPRRKPALWIRI